ncbi:glycosyltransferase family 9 protein [Mucilaginibacter sp.]|uniref:glycosyltransferase family 9 protein n=1 Tax=Mucilaginibacter sp. TaxID=1882438 RepID=UPI00262F5C33|nr:glycosyltransferase family 9 protein [Mucilaginibacter sp.]MDB4920740.1 glycosyl transferase family 9 [Mucilaginibacter sp.]
MENSWQGCKNILCIRPDNMGDLLMTGPALRALKESLNCKITVLTSSMAAGIARLMPGIDEVMIFDVPWVKNNVAAEAGAVENAVQEIRTRKFDAAVIFTVYSQNPLPTVMLAYLAGISKRLAFCRENPYRLLTDWVPDKEPYSIIRHQVRRDLELVAAVGATTLNDRLLLTINTELKECILQKLNNIGIATDKSWLIIHPGVSEPKRQYPVEKWAAAGKELIKRKGYQVIITGAAAERALCETLKEQTGMQSFNVAGIFTLEEFITLIGMAKVVVSVNTATVHIAAATGTPVVVLYALTNPQHTPWKVPCRVLPYQPHAAPQSKNEVIRQVNTFLYQQQIPMPDEHAIVCAIEELTDSDFSPNAVFAAAPPPARTPFEDRVDPAS